MERKIFERLMEWKADHDCALMLQGPRQCGKTYILNEFAKTYPDSVIVNLEYDDVADCFESVNAEKIYEELSFKGVKFDFSKGKPLFVIDEIQISDAAVSSLKPLSIDGRCDIVGSGSLLGVVLGDSHLSPMGYVRFMNMEPMDFEEFLWASGMSRAETERIRGWICEGSGMPESVRHGVTDLFRRFMVVGGMPAAVDAFMRTEDYSKVWDVLESLYGIIERDALRYSDKKDKLKILACLESIPGQLARENKQFVYRDIEKKNGAGSREYDSSLGWLERAGIINVCRNVRDLKEPLNGNVLDGSFKVYVKDSGILTYMYGKSSASAVISGDSNANMGAMMESCIAQALVCNGFDLHFYAKRDSTLEMDFIISYQKVLTALEIKSGKRKRSRSLTMLTDGTYGTKNGIKVADSPMSVDEKGIKHLPLFAPCFFESTEIKQFAPIDMDSLKKSIME